jgi:hypothetical protein
VADEETGEVPPAAPRPATDILGPPPQERENYDAFAHQPPFRARRNPARMWTIAAVAAAALMLAAAAAISILGLPRFGGALTAGSPATSLELRFQAERREMASGNELLTVTGTVTNPGESVQRVPPIRAQLRDAQGRTVYGWSISPPVGELQPRQSATFNSAEVGVPQGAKQLNLSFGPSI